MRQETRAALNDWIAELEQVASGKSDAGLTVAEIAARTGRGVKRIHQDLRAIAAEGRLKVGKRSINNLSGATVQVPVYSVEPKKKR